jgi:hypothetical protein
MKTRRLWQLRTIGCDLRRGAAMPILRACRLAVMQPEHGRTVRLRKWIFGANVAAQH